MICKSPAARANRRAHSAASDTGSTRLGPPLGPLQVGAKATALRRSIRNRECRWWVPKRSPGGSYSLGPLA